MKKVQNVKYISPQKKEKKLLAGIKILQLN